MDLTLVLLSILLFVSLSTANERASGIIGPTEYCVNDAFEAQCSSTQVLLIQRAQYGRMKVGKCVTKDVAVAMGCAVDVTTYLDRRCSGRRRCKVPVMPLLKVAHPCKEGVTSYLEVSYKCIAVAHAPRSICAQKRPIEITKTEGTISGLVAKETGLGLPNCPLSIRVPKGMHIKLRLSRFGRFEDFVHETSNHRTHDLRHHCLSHIILTEGGRQADIALCGEFARMEHVYTSAESNITIAVHHRGAMSIPNFLFHYQATGCSDMQPLPNAKMRRHGDSLTIRCNNTNGNYRLTCRKNRWEGEWKNCTLNTWAVGQLFGHKGALSKGNPSSLAVLYAYDIDIGIIMAVLIGVILGVVIGMILLAVMFVCRKGIKDNRSADYKTAETQLYEDVYEDQRKMLEHIEDKTRADHYGVSQQAPPGLELKTIGISDVTSQQQPQQPVMAVKSSPPCKHLAEKHAAFSVQCSHMIPVTRTFQAVPGVCT